jgi:hypothetical protein
VYSLCVLALILLLALYAHAAAALHQAPHILHQSLSEKRIAHMHSGPSLKKDERGALILEKNQSIVHNLSPGTSPV